MGKAGFSMKITGLDAAIDKVAEINRKLDEDVDALMEAAAYDTNDDSISNIRHQNVVDLGAGGGLLSHQGVTSPRERAYEVLNSARHAPFIEWGTGRQVQVPAEWAAYAQQYKGPYPGTWKEFEQNIKAWMNRHGIPEQFAYPMMVKILENGLPPRPFLYPAYVKNKAKLIEDLKKLFK